MTRPVPAVVALVAAACTVAASDSVSPIRRQTADPAARTPIRFAVNLTTIESAPVFVANEQSPPRFSIVGGGIPLLTTGAADLATNSETQALLRSVENPNLRIILTVAECYYRIVGRRSAGIQRLADLRGKKVATPATTSAHYYLALMLKTAKLAETDVTVVPMQVNQMAAAISRREVDAVSGWEPGAQDSIDGLAADAVVFQDRSVYRELFNLNTTVQVLQDPARRPAIVAIVRALVSASARVRSDPMPAWTLLASKVNIPVATTSASWQHFHFAGALPGDLMNVLDAEEAWVADLQHRTRRPRQALSPLVDDTVLKEALAKR